MKKKSSEKKSKVETATDWLQLHFYSRDALEQHKTLLLFISFSTSHTFKRFYFFFDFRDVEKFSMMKKKVQIKYFWEFYSSIFIFISKKSVSREIKIIEIYDFSLKCCLFVFDEMQFVFLNHLFLAGSLMAQNLYFIFSFSIFTHREPQTRDHKSHQTLQLITRWFLSFVVS